MKCIAPATVKGEVIAPASKSVAIRAIAAAALACGASTLRGRFEALDIQAALQIARTMGSSVQEFSERVVIAPGAVPTRLRLDAGESALCQRLFTVIASLADGPHVIEARGSLRERPVEVLTATLESFGVGVVSQGGGTLSVQGKLHPGTYTVDGSFSSQVISGLLMALPLLSESSLLHLSAMTSAPYLELTCEVLRSFGVSVALDLRAQHCSIPGAQQYHGANLEIEGDWSGAAALLVAGAIAGEVTVHGLNLDSRQGDRRIVEILQQAGAFVTTQPGCITVQRRPLRAISCDLTDTPDLLPVLSVLALYGDEPSVFTGTARLRHKESDRPGVLQAELSALGCQVDIFSDRMVVSPGIPMGGRASAHGDHRIAMAIALGGIRSTSGVVLMDDSSVAKSYPSFFDDLDRLMVVGEGLSA